MYRDSHLRKSWVDIDLQQIVSNYQVYKENLGASKLLPILKQTHMGMVMLKLHGC